MKTKHYLSGITAIFMLLFGQSVLAGGPWLNGKNHGFVQVQTILPAYSYDALLMGRFGDTKPVNRLTHSSDYSIYFEYGITDKLDVISYLPFRYVKTGELSEEQLGGNLLEAGDLSGLSNYQLALKYKLLDKKVKIAVSLQTAWNTARLDLDKGLATGYPANSFGAMLHIGRSKEKHYGFLELGYNYLTHGFSDGIVLRVEHGWKLGNSFYVGGALNSRFSMHNGSYSNENLAQTGLSPNNQQWAFLAVKASYERENGFGANLSVPLVPIAFKNVGYNGAVVLGFYKKF